MSTSPSFPQLLWRIAVNDTTGAIQVNQQGDGVQIDRELFDRIYLASGTFRTRRIVSFIRQLHIYGFHQDSSLPPTQQPNGRRVTIYLHKSFNFHRPDWSHVKRETNTTGRTRSRQRHTGGQHSAGWHENIQLTDPNCDSDTFVQLYRLFPDLLVPNRPGPMTLYNGAYGSSAGESVVDYREWLNFPTDNFGTTSLFNQAESVHAGPQPEYLPL